MSSGAALDATSTLSLPDLERRAGEHAASREYGLALADYRALLRRFPQHAHANAWKKQIAELRRMQGEGGQTR